MLPRDSKQKANLDYPFTSRRLTWVQLLELAGLCAQCRRSRAQSIMLLLFETAAGYALFKVLKEGKLQEAEARAATVGRALTA